MEVVRAKKMSHGEGRKVAGRRNAAIRSMRIGKPVRRSVGLSTLWAWDFPPSWVFQSDDGGDVDTERRSVGWIDCDSPVVTVPTLQKNDDQGSVAADSTAGSEVSCASMFSVESMKKPGACVGFGGPWPWDRFLRPEQDPYYRAEMDDEDSESNEGVDAKVNHHMDMLCFAVLPYSFEQCWADELHFADFDGLKARQSLPRPHVTRSVAPSSTNKMDRRQFPTQEVLRPPPEQVERAKKIHQAARIKARQDQNKKISRVSDWRHRSAALEAEVNRRRSVRRGTVNIKEIIISNDAVSVDAEDISLPGVLKIMAVLKPDGVGGQSTAKIPNGDASAIQAECEEKEVATDASASVEGYLSDGSTILHYLERWQDSDRKIPAEESIAELTEDGIEEDSREDSTEIKLFLNDDDGDDDKEGFNDEGEEADDSLVFSKTSIAEVLADVSSEVDEMRKGEASSVSMTAPGIIAQSKLARKEWIKLDCASESDNNKNGEGIDSVPSETMLQIERTGTHKESSLPRRNPRSRPLSIRLSANKKKAWANAWDEAGLLSDTVVVARWHGEDDIAAQASSSSCKSTNIEEKGDGSHKKKEKQVKSLTLPDQGDESQSSESTQNNGFLRTAKEPTEKEDGAPSGSPTVPQALPPRDKVSSSPSPPRPTEKAESFGVSLSEHLAATGAKGGLGMPKAGCEGSIRTMETACSTNPSEDGFVPSPYAPARTNFRPDALVGTNARNRRRALEVQFANRKGPATSLESARSLEVAILQSLKKKVDDSIGTSASLKTTKTLDTTEMMQRIRHERNRVAERSKSLRRLESASQQAGICAPDWNVW